MEFKDKFSANFLYFLQLNDCDRFRIFTCYKMQF